MDCVDSKAEFFGSRGQSLTELATHNELHFLSAGCISVLLAILDVHQSHQLFIHNVLWAMHSNAVQPVFRSHKHTLTFCFHSHLGIYTQPCHICNSLLDAERMQC